MPFLEIRNVSKSFGHVYALREVDFQVDRGGIIGLLGDNGAGKSSLIKVISGVHRPDSGQILIDGSVMPRWSVALARQHGIETVFQDQALAPQQSIARNIFMGRERVGPFGLTRTGQQHREAERLMREIGFTSKLITPDSIVATLSGGERQGVAIARALYFQASLIILDEPTTSLSLTECEKVFRSWTGSARRALPAFSSHTTRTTPMTSPTASWSWITDGSCSRSSAARSPWSSSPTSSRASPKAGRNPTKAKALVRKSRGPYDRTDRVQARHAGSFDPRIGFRASSTRSAVPSGRSCSFL